MKTETITYKEEFNRFSLLLTESKSYQNLYNKIKAIVDKNKIVTRKRKGHKITDSDDDDNNDENNNNKVHNIIFKFLKNLFCYF